MLKIESTNPGISASKKEFPGNSNFNLGIITLSIIFLNDALFSAVSNLNGSIVFFI